MCIRRFISILDNLLSKKKTLAFWMSMRPYFFELRTVTDNVPTICLSVSQPKQPRSALAVKRVQNGGMALWEENS